MVTVSPAAKLTVPLSASVCVAVARRRPSDHRDVGPHGQRRPLVDGEVAGEDVAEVGGGLRADGVQGERLAAGEGVRLDVDVWKRRLLLPLPDRYCTSMAGMYSGRSKPLPTTGRRR